MSRFARAVLIMGVFALLSPVAAWAQYPPYPSPVVGFDEPPIDCPTPPYAACMDMFQKPETSGTTDIYIKMNVTEPNDPNYCPGCNWAAKVSANAIAGDASLNGYFQWVDPNNPDAWLRWTTFNGLVHPNPALHTGGKVRFWIVNWGEGVLGKDALGLCLGIRETDANVPQMEDGHTTGEIEWVGVDTTPNAVIDGGNRVVDTTKVGDDVYIYGPPGWNLGDPNDPNNPPPYAAIIGPGDNGVLDTTDPNDDDRIRFGWYHGPNRARIPIPAIVLAVSPAAVWLEWDLSTGVVSKWDDPNQAWEPQGGGIAGFTGNGTFEVTRGALEHLALTKVPGDTGPVGFVLIDLMQFESPAPDPAVPPAVKSPIIHGADKVFVTGLQYLVDQVALFRDSNNPEQTINVNGDPPPAEVQFDLLQAAQEGQVFRAKQRYGPTGTWSDFSLPVTVLSGPPPYSFSILLDEGGTGSCDYTTGGWEWVGVSSVTGWVPQGTALVTPDDAKWQYVDIPFDQPAVIIAGLGGNGALAAHPWGVYTTDSVWLTIGPGLDPNDPNNQGPWEVFVDAVQVLDLNHQPAQTILNMEDGVNRFSGVRGQSPVQAVSTTLSNTTAYDGSTSHRFSWSYSATGNSLGVLQRVGGSCGTSALIPDISSSTGVRFHLYCRGKRTAPTISLPTVVGPIIVGNQTDVRVNCDSTASAVQLFIDGTAGPSLPPGGASYVDFTGLSMTPGQSISAQQTIGARAVSDYAYPRVVLATPPAPTVQSPVLPGATTVTVTGCLTAQYATATTVTVYVRDPNNVFINSYSAPGGTATVNVTGIPALPKYYRISATQTVNTATSAESAQVVVTAPAPIIYKAPAAGEPSVRVQGLHPSAEAVSIIVNGTTEYKQPCSTPPPHYVDVLITGVPLAAGNTITAKQWINALDGVETMAETVTNAGTNVFCDSFEAYTLDPNDALYLATWSTATSPRPTVQNDNNSTIPGAQSVFVKAGVAGSTGAGRISHTIANTTPSAVSPVVWNVNVYDRYGPGVSNVQFAQLNRLGTGNFLQHVGMLSWSPQNTNYYQYRAIYFGGPNWIDLTDLDASQRSVGWHNFTTVHKGTYIDIYVDGFLVRKNLPLTGAPAYDTCRIGPGYTSDGSAWYDDYCVETGAVRFNTLLPYAPKVVSPVQQGDTVVKVGNIHLNANRVDVYDNNVPVGSVILVPPNAPGTVDANVPALTWQHLITATQTTSTGLSPISAALEVGKGNGDLLVCIGIRETNDGGLLGSPGGTSGQIEWIGVDPNDPNNPVPHGKSLPADPNWQTFTFDPASDRIGPFPNSGDGVITATRGTLEHLAVTVNANAANRSSGPYTLYVDNVVNVGAAPGGVDFLITGFEGFAPPAEVLFQDPMYSGTTSGNMSYPPSASECSAAQYYAGTQSELLTWFFKDTQATRWARITTSGADNMRQPVIDLTKPIRLSLLLQPSVATGACCFHNATCQVMTQADCLAATGGHYRGDGTTCTLEYCVCRGDANCDGVISFADINPFVAALGNPGGACSFDNCDVNNDGLVNFADINPFVAALGGSGQCPY